MDVWCAHDNIDFQTNPNRFNRLIRLSGDGETAWTTSLFLCSAIAVDEGNLIALHCPNGVGSLVLSLVDLSDAIAPIVADFSSETLGIDAKCIDAVFGRGDSLHLLQGLRWTTIKVSAVRAALLDESR